MTDHELTASDLLPAQWRALHNSSTMTPEKRLALAVLEDAIRAFQTRGLGRKSVSAYFEAVDWLFGAGDGIFSMDGVCDLLGIEASVLRARLKDWDGRLSSRRSPVKGNGGARPTATTKRVRG